MIVEVSPVESFIIVNFKNNSTLSMNSLTALNRAQDHTRPLVPK